MGPICRLKNEMDIKWYYENKFSKKRVSQWTPVCLANLSLLQHQTQIRKAVNYYMSKLWQVWSMAKSYREVCYSRSLLYLNSSYVEVAKATIQVLN